MLLRPRPLPSSLRAIAGALAAAAVTAAVAAAVAAPAACQTPAPRTAAEASDFTATSRAEDVARFLDACRGLPHGDRVTVRAAGKSEQGRDLLVARLAAPATAAPAGAASRPAPLRALVIGNIHAGEIEGKEALQQLAREVASGEHGELLAHCEVHVLPIYNVDGNEAVGPKNRPGQNGPDVVGQRANANGLDLNRDFVKVDAAETRVLLRLFREIDPHLFVDLHTTNGSYHGYHLTYSPCLSPNLDPGIATLSRTLLDDATASMREAGFATFDYGNFETRDWDGGGAPESKAGVRGWYSYDHRARYGVNYFGLRNRIAVLSEAYSYDGFRERVAATHAFVLGVLRALVARRADVLAAAAAADARLAAEPVAFGYASTFAPAERLPVLVGDVDEIAGDAGRPTRRVRKGTAVAEEMPVARAFVATATRPLPHAWAVLAPSADALDRLRQHGVEHEVLAAPRAVRAERFAVSAKKKPKRPYQGHQELVLAGTWQEPADVELPTGTVLVPARQRLGRLAATLLEAESEDSLSSWNFFEAQTGDHYPVLRVVASR
jgi:hypothetical protein